MNTPQASVLVFLVVAALGIVCGFAAVTNTQPRLPDAATLSPVTSLSHIVTKYFIVPLDAFLVRPESESKDVVKAPGREPFDAGTRPETSLRLTSVLLADLDEEPRTLLLEDIGQRFGPHRTAVARVRNSIPECHSVALSCITAGDSCNTTEQFGGPRDVKAPSVVQTVYAPKAGAQGLPRVHVGSGISLAPSSVTYSAEAPQQR